MATKKRVEISPHPSPVGFAGLQPAGAMVVDEKPGTVTTIDRAKQYYKAAITLCGGLLVVLSQVVVPEPADGWVATAIVTLTAVLTYLKANEIWVDGLGVHEPIPAPATPTAVPVRSRFAATLRRRRNDA